MPQQNEDPISKLIAAARFAHTWLSRGLTPIETVASAPVRLRLAEAVEYAEASQRGAIPTYIALPLAGEAIPNKPRPKPRPGGGRPVAMIRRKPRRS